MSEISDKQAQVQVLKKIKPSHREMARRLALGQTIAQVAREMFIDPSRLGVIAKSPLFKQELDKFMTQRDEGVVNVQKEFQELAPVATEIIEKMMYSAKSESLRLRAAETVLDRGGHGPITKGMMQINSNVNIQTGHMSDKELRDLVKKRIGAINNKETTKAERVASAEALDVEFEEVQSGQDEPTKEDKPKEQPIKLISL